MEKLFDLIASDFASLYRELLRHSVLTPHGLNIDAFQAVFDRMHTEYMHYAESTPTQPYHMYVVENIIHLAAAYLSLPTDVSPNSRAFGLYLVFFLYSTQPSLHTSSSSSSLVVKVPVSAGTMQTYLDDIESGGAEGTIISPQLGRRVTDGERRILLSMHQQGALHVMPFVDISLHLRAILKAHDAEGVPLVTGANVNDTIERPSHVAGAGRSDGDLLRQLEAYSAMKQRLGLNN